MTFALNAEMVATPDLGFPNLHGETIAFFQEMERRLSLLGLGVQDCRIESPAHEATYARRRTYLYTKKGDHLVGWWGFANSIVPSADGRYTLIEGGVVETRYWGDR